MNSCEMTDRCIFFNDKMHDYPFAAEQMKKTLCLGDNTNCARYMVLDALGRDHVPADLFPNDIARAGRVIAGSDRPLNV